MKKLRANLKTKYKTEIDLIIANKDKINWDKNLEAKLFHLLD